MCRARWFLARLAVPEGFSAGPASARITQDDAPASSMDAIVKGTLDGLQIVAAVAATLIVMVALVALVNAMLGQLGAIGGAPLTLERILGYLCMPFAFIIGIPVADLGAAGSLIGKKIVLNEFLAYLDLIRVPAGELSERFAAADHVCAVRLRQSRLARHPDRRPDGALPGAAAPRSSSWRRARSSLVSWRPC